MEFTVIQIQTGGRNMLRPLHLQCCFVGGGDLSRPRILKTEIIFLAKMAGAVLLPKLPIDYSNSRLMSEDLLAILWINAKIAMLNCQLRH